jgi:hypothetical protein
MAFYPVETNMYRVIENTLTTRGTQQYLIVDEEGLVVDGPFDSMGRAEQRKRELDEEDIFDMFGVTDVNSITDFLGYNEWE